MKYFPLIVFSDFDGTVTEHETLEGFIQLFVEEDVRKAGEKIIKSGRSVKDGVKEMISRIPIEEYLEKKNYFYGISIRSGFSEFVDYLKEHNIPLIILSGGIREMVTCSLEKYMDAIEDLYAADINFQDGKVHLWSHYETEHEVVGKCEIMSLYQYDKAICIGDSYSDFRMGMNADIVFARDRLAEQMEKAGVDYFEFETFYDIIEQLKNMLGEKL